MQQKVINELCRWIMSDNFREWAEEIVGAPCEVQIHHEGDTRICFDLII